MSQHARHAESRLHELLNSLEPFDDSVVRLRYQEGEQSLPRIAAALSSTTEQVTATLMSIYRRVASVLETPTGATIEYSTRRPV